METGRLGFLVLLAGYSLLCRLLPYGLSLAGVSIDPATTWYPWNFAPLMAVTLLGGAVASSSLWSVALPMIILTLGNFGIWALTGKFEYGFHDSQPFVYAGYIVGACAGMLLRHRPSIALALPLAIVSEVIFFLITNFGVWSLDTWSSYPNTPAGLMQCYAAALPFLARSLLSTSMFTVLLFSPLGLRMAGYAPAPARAALA